MAIKIIGTSYNNDIADAIASSLGGSNAWKKNNYLATVTYRQYHQES